jgi:hypothetical protein
MVTVRVSASPLPHDLPSPDRVLLFLDMKYLWTALSDILFIGLLFFVFTNTYDPDTEKILAAITIAYLAVINSTNALSRQIGLASSGILGVIIELHKKAHPTADAEVEEAEDALKAATEQRATSDIKMLIHAATNVCVAIVMALILIS